MKKSLTILSLLFLTNFFTSSCNNRQSIIKSYSENLKTCMKQCDEMEAKYEKEYTDCRNQCRTDLLNRFENCKKISKPDTFIKCVEDAFKAAEECNRQCDATWGNHKKEIEKCREECISHTEIKQ